MGSVGIFITKNVAAELEDYFCKYNNYSTAIAKLMQHDKNCYYNALSGAQILYIHNSTKVRFEELKPTDWSADKFLEALFIFAEKYPEAIKDPNHEIITQEKNPCEKHEEN